MIRLRPKVRTARATACAWRWPKLVKRGSRIPGSRRVAEKTRLNSVCPWRIKITRVFLNSRGRAEEIASLSDRRSPARSRQAADPAHERACRGDIRPPCSQNAAEARSPVFSVRQQSAEGDGRVSAIFRHHPVRDGRGIPGAAAAQRSRPAHRKRAAPRTVRAAAAAAAGQTDRRWSSQRPGAAATAIAAAPADAVAEGLNRIRRADPSFDPSQFLEGARIAFEMIVDAFADG